MSDLYATPGSQFEAVISGAPTGAPMGVRVLDDAGATVVARTLATEIVAGSGVYSAPLTAPVTAGSYIVFWDNGTVSPTTTATDNLTVTYSTPGVAPASPYLLTLAEYKAFTGIDPTDTRTDAQVESLIPTVSRAIKVFTGRDFTVSDNTQSDRTFQYDGSGFLDIDDCTQVISLSTDAGVPGQTYDLTVNQWVAMPQDDTEVFYYILIQGGPFGYSGEMGFERNLDNYVWVPRSPLITVTASWGWPFIPSDVKLAAALILSSLTTDSGHSEDMTAESIEGFSRSWGNKAGTFQSLFIPNRARDILASYAKMFV